MFSTRTEDLSKRAVQRERDKKQKKKKEEENFYEILFPTRRARERGDVDERRRRKSGEEVEKRKETKGKRKSEDGEVSGTHDRHVDEKKQVWCREEWPAS